MPVEEKSLPSSWHVLSPPVPRHMVLIPAPHTPPLSSADTGGPPTSMCACTAVPGRAHGYGQCFISLPPTSILSRWLVPLAPPPQQQLPPQHSLPQCLQSQPFPAAADATAGSSWAGAGSHLGLPPPYLHMESGQRGVSLCAKAPGICPETDQYNASCLKP